MEDLKKSVKELEVKLDDNVKLIIQNMNRLHSHEEKINNNAYKIEQNSYALEILKDYKAISKKVTTILIIVLFMWFVTIGYLVYVLNDIGTINETTTHEISQEADDGSNYYVGRDGDING